MKLSKAKPEIKPEIKPERRHVVAGCATCEIHGKGMMPSHDASSMCESGKHEHCTCDLCF